MKEELDKIWQKVLGELEVTLSKANFTTWFSGTFIYDAKNGVFTVGVPSIFIERWLKNHYTKEIRNALMRHSKETVKDVVYKVSTQPKIDGKNSDKEKVIHRPVDNSGEEKLENVEVIEQLSTSRDDSLGTLNIRYQFDNFIVGSSNQLAHAASLSVAKKPGKAYNPLFIYGDSGLGKTHLLQAIGNTIIKNNPKTRVLYVSSETFVNDFIEAVQSGRAKKFKDTYRNVDLLLIDDIQFIGAKEQTQEEFFHTFNHLHQKNKQVVLTSDRAPKDIKGLENRLKTRFEWGMVADIQSPDFETRSAILREKCQEKGFDADDELIEFIANNIDSSIRNLEGALIKLFAFADLSGEKPNIAMAERVLSEIISSNEKKHYVSSQDVIKAIEKFYRVSAEDIASRKRNREIIKPRQVCMYILKNIVGMSYPAIGTELGGKDHSTVMHGCREISKGIVNSKQLKDEIELIKELIFEN